MAGTNSLKRFLKKKIGVQRNTKINKKRNRVITLDLIRTDRKSKSEAKVS